MYVLKTTLISNNRLVTSTTWVRNKLTKSVVNPINNSTNLVFINYFFLKKLTLRNSLTHVLLNPTLFKITSTVENCNSYKLILHVLNKTYLTGLNKDTTGGVLNLGSAVQLTNLQPHNKFKFTVFKKIYAFFANNKIHKNIIPLYYHTLIRFVENCSGKKTLLQFYPFVNQCINKDFIVRYKI